MLKLHLKYQYYAIVHYFIKTVRYAYWRNISVTCTTVELFSDLYWKIVTFMHTSKPDESMNVVTIAMLDL